MAGQNWRKNKKGILVNSQGKTALEVRLDKYAAKLKVRKEKLAAKTRKKDVVKNFEMASQKLESAKKSKNPEEKKNAELLFQATKKAKTENKIVAFDRPTEEKRRKKREKKAIEMERTLLENQSVRDKAKNEKVAMNLQELGLRQESRKALNKYSLDSTPFEANQAKKTDKPLGVSKAEKKRMAKNQVSKFKRKKEG